MRRSAPSIVCTAPALLVSAAAAACEPSLREEGARVVRSAAYAVAWVPEPKPVPVGAHFVLNLAVCVVNGGPAIKSIVVDAEMPEHRHGMNYRATVSPLGNGRYRAEGLLFHMPGRWRLIVEVRATSGRTARLTDDMLVE